MLGYHYEQIPVPHQHDHLCSYHSLYNAKCIVKNDYQRLTRGALPRDKNGNVIPRRKGIDAFIRVCRGQKNIPGRRGIWETADGLITLIGRDGLDLDVLRNREKVDQDACVNDKLDSNLSIINDWYEFVSGAQDLENLEIFEGAQLCKNIRSFRDASIPQVVIMNTGNHWIVLKLEKNKAGIKVTLADSASNLYCNAPSVNAIVAAFSGDATILKKLESELEVEKKDREKQRAADLKAHLADKKSKNKKK